MPSLRGSIRPVLRLCNRYPTLSGVLLGVVITGAWLRFVPADSPLPRIDILLFAGTGVLTLIVAIIARARSRDEDEW